MDLLGFAHSGHLGTGPRVRIGQRQVCADFPGRRRLVRRAHAHRSWATGASQVKATASVDRTATQADASPADEAKTSPLKLYNTLSRSKEVFETVEPGVVRFYSCGPTVYDYAHIGNFRAFLTYDVVKRWLICLGYKVRHVMNLTDVDDKIIRRVAESAGKITAKELTDKYADAFFADLNLLNVIMADHYPRATEHIGEIDNVVAGLRKRGYAYEADGSTYFSVGQFAPYGRLAQLDRRRNDSERTEAATNDSDEYDKEDVRDFALWKAYKPEDGEVFWEPPSLAKGRPGWHIECTCMAIKYLGPKLDIHGGGIDLVFPHHENEIAQAEAFTGESFSRFWIHNGFVNIDNEKMSKSLGNFKTLRDIVRKPDDARAFRYLVVSSQYRSALAFTAQCMKSARSTIKRLDALRQKLRNVQAPGDVGAMADTAQKARLDFAEAMNDDLNTPRAAAAMFSLVNAAEKAIKADKLSKAAAEEVLTCLEEFDQVFGIFYTPVLPEASSDAAAAAQTEEHVEVTPELLSLLEARADARKAKDWSRADAIRDELAAAGFVVVDTADGPQLRPKD